ncbi:MAG: hypothetical protein SF339_27250 [Blastocatellia bacterium]|nr:hypothetical protein [Blastocatellia bacterium]
MSNLLVVLVAVLAIVNGSLSSWFLGERLSLRVRASIGAVVGLALLSWTGFLIALLVGMGSLSIGLTVGLFLLLFLWLVRRVGRERVSVAIGEAFGRGWDGGEILYVGGWSLLLIALFSRVVMFDADGLHTAPANNFGDLPFHFSVITSFAYGENLPPQNPIFAGMKFTYPFLIDFLTAFFIRCGADWRVAFFVENFALSLALVGLLEFLTMRIFGNRLAARLAPVLFLFNGGLGFVNFFRELYDPIGDRLQFLTHLPKAYTMNNSLMTSAGEIPLRWGNVFTTLLIPQRSMLFGLPIVAMILALWWMAVAEDGEGGDAAPAIGGFSRRRRLLLAAGVLAGMLPMLHAHGFFSVAIASVPMALLFFSWDWLAFFLPTGLLALPQALYLRGTPVKIKLAERLFHWEAGEANPLLFWAVNFGVLIAALLAALLLKRYTDARQARFYPPFVLWFLVPCIWMLAPWGWDNIKVFVYWALASVPFAAMLLSSLFTGRRVLRPLAAGLLAALTLSGAIDVFRALSPVENLQLFSREEMEVAELLRQRTPPRAVILHAPIHNSTVALSGRQSVLGYPGHLWTHGIEYGPREQEIRLIYKGGSDSLDPLARLGVDYLIIGPRERAELAPDEADFAARYPLVIEHEGYRVFRIRME